MKFYINLTWSKIIALIVLISAVVLDLYLKTDGKIFMYSLPFVTFLITGKQFFDLKKGE